MECKLLFQVLSLCFSALALLEGHTISQRTHYDPRRPHHDCSSHPTFTEWSTWGDCTAVHFDTAVAPCGPGKRRRHRQQNLSLTTPVSSWWGSYYAEHRPCRPQCFGKDLYQVETCVVTGHTSCFANSPVELCTFDGTGASAPVCAAGINSLTLYDLAIANSVLDATNPVLFLQSTVGTGTDPVAYYALGDVFLPTLTYKYCLTYKARLDPGTILYAGKLSVPAATLATDLAFIAAQAVGEGTRYHSGKTCHNEVILQCTYGSPETATKLASFSVEITTEETFLVAFVMVPQLTSDPVGFTGGELDDVGIVEGPC